MAKMFLMFLLLLTGLIIGGEDKNIILDIAEIEQMLSQDSVTILIPKDIRFKGDAAKTTMIKRDDGLFFRVKIKRAPQGGEGYNNQPRYEIAAYELQKLFLESHEYVVPPTAARAFDLQDYERIEANLFPTFGDTKSVFCTLQYWLNNVSANEVYQRERLENDRLYAYHLANLNILTYLIRHSDSNKGNFLISTDPQSPRLFAVDNGMAFGNITSERGYDWREIRVKELPEATVTRLRTITYQQLQEKLGVVAQFEEQGSHFQPTARTANLDPDRGVRYQNNVVQFGLTRTEIDDLWQRLEKLLSRVDEGEMLLTAF